MKNHTLLVRTVVATFLLVVAVAAAGAAAVDDPEAIAAAAFDLRMAGRVDEAVELLEAALKDQPTAGVLHYELARARLLLLDIGAMHEEAASAVRLAPDNSEYRYFAAMAAAYSLIDAAHQGNEERMQAMGNEVFNQLETILQTDPDHHQARYFLVQQSVEMAPEVGIKVDGTEDHVRLLEEKDPILGAKARCCLVDEKEQRKIWKQVLADNPDDCRALVEAADGLITCGELDTAEACLDKAIGKDKRSCYGLLRLGLAYFMQEDWDRAIELTQKYLDTDPPVALRAYAVGRLGMIHHRKGDADRGRELMNKSREMDPHVWQTVMPPPKEIFTPIQPA